MSIVYVKKKQPKRMPILEWLYPKKIRETKCSECGRPFLEYPDREPHHRFKAGDVDLHLYQESARGQFTFRLRVGVWQKDKDSYYYAQLISRTYFEDLQAALAETIEYVRRCEEEEREKRRKKEEERRMK